MELDLAVVDGREEAGGHQDALATEEGVLGTPPTLAEEHFDGEEGRSYHHGPGSIEQHIAPRSPHYGLEHHLLGRAHAMVESRTPQLRVRDGQCDGRTVEAYPDLGPCGTGVIEERPYGQLGLTDVRSDDVAHRVLVGRG
jgi:hypothetical protein